MREITCPASSTGSPRQINRRTAQLLHAGFERQARARAGFFENHHQRAVGQRPILLIGFEFLFDDAGAFE
jgi:hypothetical protein